MTQDANDIAREHGADGLRAVFDNTAIDKAEETETPEPEPPRFRLIPFNEINLPTAVDYAVKGILPRIGVVSVWGPYSCGKSFWTLNLVMHIALAWEFRGRPVKPGTAVYCAFEGQSGFAKRVEAFRQHYMGEEAEEVPFYLMPLSMDLIQDVGQLIDDIKTQAIEPNVVVLDTLARSMSGDENSNADMGRYFAAADVIRETFACLVIIVHHSGYDDSHSRGGTALPSNSEGLIKVYRDTRENVCSIVQKYKDGEVGDETTSRLEQIVVGTDDEGLEITSCVVVEAEAIASSISDGPRLTKNQQTMLTILERAGADGLTISEWNDQAREVGIGNSRKQDLYDLRVALDKKKLAYEFDGRWKLTFKG